MCLLVYLLDKEAWIKKETNTHILCIRMYVYLKETVDSQQYLSAGRFIPLGVEAPADASKALADGAPSGQ
jgi:hypothetical protein